MTDQRTNELKNFTAADYWRWACIILFISTFGPLIVHSVVTLSF